MRTFYLTKLFFITLLIALNTELIAYNNQESITSSENLKTKIRKGIDYIYNIQFDSAEVIFKEITLNYPDNPAGKFFIAMIDWWKIILDPDNESYDELFFEKLEDVIYFCNQLLERNDKNFDAIFFKGGAIGFRGRLRALRDSWLKAADDGREALSILNLAWSIDSTNYDILFGMGIYNYFAEVIPEEFPLIKPLMIFFPKGNKQKGLEQLKLAADYAQYASTEAMYFLLMAYYNYEDDIYEAKNYARILNSKYPNNPVFHRYLGRTFIRSGDYTTAAKVFQVIYDSGLEGKAGYNKNAMREASYYIGLNYRFMGLYDSSAYYFNQCVELSKKLDKKGNESGFQASAALNLGMVYDLMGNRKEAIKLYNYVLSIKNWSDTHQAAKRYLNIPYGN